MDTIATTNMCMHLIGIDGRAVRELVHLVGGLYENWSR
mgnify:CR=1 FL=1